MTSPTPADLVITPRDRRFARDASPCRWWHGGDPFRTAVFNALSATFPQGEAFFVDSVRRFRDGVPPRLERDIAAFVRQEVTHSREHLAFNRQLSDAGYDMTPLTAQVDRRLAVLRAKPAIVSLAATTVLEHFTAILAHLLLADPDLLAGADPEVAALWRWHAAEEIEHKSVAYDTWLHATRDWSPFKRWLVRALVLLRVTKNFLIDRTRGALALLRQDGITGPRAWAGLFRATFVAPAIVPRVAGRWLRYLVPSYHPWEEDDRALIAAA